MRRIDQLTKQAAMGPDRFILYSRKRFGVRFERDEVIELKKAWLDTFPEVREYLKWISWQMERADGSFTHVHPRLPVSSEAVAARAGVGMKLQIRGKWYWVAWHWLGGRGLCHWAYFRHPGRWTLWFGPLTVSREK